MGGGIYRKGRKLTIYQESSREIKITGEQERKKWEERKSKDVETIENKAAPVRKCPVCKVLVIGLCPLCGGKD